MPPRPTNWAMWGKMTLAFIGCSVGGPALVYYVSPTEEELFQKYNPELQRRSLENRIGKQEDFDSFVGKLKEYSKSDRHVWEAAAIDEDSKREGKLKEQMKLVEEIRRRKEEMRKDGHRGVPGGSL
ncbi:hypothetical protein HYALB_00012226 [Hymenoscyphus albidus]|uniref:Cytochrome b mRNA-processing protein 4 n=1 Tax=Hymenoscyphus albidus TaxID=595503 RepID=A0A9N9LW92_9HELO|nr:hypothetical protein HYALB_00012226 [Hymenoscyphus albidus]